MSAIDGVKGMQSWLDLFRPGPEGAVTHARQSLNERLLTDGFVDVYSGTMSAIKAQLDTTMSLSETAGTDFKTVAEVMAALQSAAENNPDWARSALARVQPNRAVTLLK